MRGQPFREKARYEKALDIDQDNAGARGRPFTEKACYKGASDIDENNARAWNNPGWGSR